MYKYVSNGVVSLFQVGHVCQFWILMNCSGGSRISQFVTCGRGFGLHSGKANALKIICMSLTCLLDMSQHMKRFYSFTFYGFDLRQVHMMHIHAIVKKVYNSKNIKLMDFDLLTSTKMSICERG